MLCIAYPFFFNHRFVSMKIYWVTVTINMHTKSLIHKHVFKLSCPARGPCKTLSPTEEEVFLNFTIISLYCNARTDWLSPGETNTDPPSDTRSRIKKRRRYIHTIAHFHSPTYTHLHTHTHTESLLNKTTHSTNSFANYYTSPNQRLFCLIWLTTIAQRQSPFPSVFKMALGTALVLTAVWELRDNVLDCMMISEA